MPVNPKTAAMIEIRKNISAHFSNDMALPFARFTGRHRTGADSQLARPLTRLRSLRS
jgi:hypothetical protein